MKDLIVACEIVGKKIVQIVKKREVISDGFVHFQNYVQIGHNWIAIDSRGVDEKADLFWTPATEFFDKSCERVFDELVGLEIFHVVVSDYLPTFGLVLSNGELLYSADLGPPFNAFGPLHQCLGPFFKACEMIDFWERSPIDSI